MFWFESRIWGRIYCTSMGTAAGTGKPSWLCPVVLWKGTILCWYWESVLESFRTSPTSRYLPPPPLLHILVLYEPGWRGRWKLSRTGSYAGWNSGKFAGDRNGRNSNRTIGRAIRLLQIETDWRWWSRNSISFKIISVIFYASWIRCASNSRNATSPRRYSRASTSFSKFN